MEAVHSRYDLRVEIARGAVGSVWRAVDRASGEPVAVKLLRPEIAGEPDLVEGFAAEAEILAALDHPGIVRLRDFVVGGTGAALVLDLVDGEDLRRRVRRDGPVPPAVAAHVAAQVADVLAYLHARGVVHGDVKPGNLLVPADGGAMKLADFGIARRIDADATRATHATPEYVAPEVVNGAVPGPASDVYSLGIALYELLTGRTPYRGGSPAQVLGRHATCRPVPPPGLPAVVWPLIEDCLAPDPAARPHARVLAARLRGVETALDGMPALPPLSGGQVTWWPRPGGATVARVAAPVAWVPLRTAPVSPASAYGGRVVAIPVAHLEPVLPVLPAGSPPTFSESGASAASDPPLSLKVGERAGRRRRVALAVAAAVVAAVALAGGVAVTLGSLGGTTSAEDAGGHTVAPAPSVGATGAPAAEPDPTTVPTNQPTTEPTTTDPTTEPTTDVVPTPVPAPTGGPTSSAGGTGQPAPAFEDPDLGSLPGIGDLMPTMPPVG